MGKDCLNSSDLDELDEYDVFLRKASNQNQRANKERKKTIACAPRENNEPLLEAIPNDRQLYENIQTYQVKRSKYD